MYSCPALLLHSAAVPPLSASKDSISVQKMKLKKKKKSIFTNWLLLVKMLISKITYFWPSLNPCALIALRHFVVKNDIANIMQRPKNLYFFLVQSLHTVLWQTNIFCQNFQKTNPHQIIFLPFRQSSLNWMSP